MVELYAFSFLRFTIKVELRRSAWHGYQWCVRNIKWLYFMVHSQKIIIISDSSPLTRGWVMVLWKKKKVKFLLSQSLDFFWSLKESLAHRKSPGFTIWCPSYCGTKQCTVLVAAILLNHWLDQYNMAPGNSGIWTSAFGSLVFYLRL